MPTDLTHIRLLATVNASMFHKVSFRDKPLVANVTLERLFAGMSALVSLHIALIAEWCATFFAVVVSPVGMRPMMSLETTFLRKAFAALAALAALVRLVFAARQSVELETAFSFKALAAQIARKVRNVTMDPLVTDQGGS